MSSTHLSLCYHLVFSTHDRLRWIDKSWQERLAKYIGGIVRDIEGIAIEIGGDSDHSHILARLPSSTNTMQYWVGRRCSHQGMFFRTFNSHF
jgi:hypothetical protein